MAKKLENLIPGKYKDKTSHVYYYIERTLDGRYIFRNSEMKPMKIDNIDLFLNEIKKVPDSEEDYKN